MNVLFLTTLPTLKARNSPYMQYYFKQFFVLHSSEVIFSFLIKKSRQKAIEIETAFFHSLANPKERTLDHFFYASHIRHNFSYKLIPIIDELVEIFLKLSMKTVQVHLIIWTTLKSVQSALTHLQRPRKILMSQRNYESFFSSVHLDAAFSKIRLGLNLPKGKE